MRSTALPIFFKLAVALVLAASLPAQAQEPLFGTWKMDAVKSKYSPGPVPKSNIAKWQSYQGGVKVTLDVVPATSDNQHWECTGQFNGKDNPVTGNNPDADTMAFKKIDARTYEVANKRGGQKIMTARIVVAEDGKTRLTTQTGRNAKGETVKNVRFYGRQ